VAVSETVRDINQSITLFQAAWPIKTQDRQVWPVFHWIFSPPLHSTPIWKCWSRSLIGSRILAFKWRENHWPICQPMHTYNAYKQQTVALWLTTLHKSSNQWRSKALRGPGSTVTWGPLSCFAPARSAESGVGLWEGLQLGSGVGLSSPVGSPAAKSFYAFCVLRWSRLLLKTSACTVISHIFVTRCGLRSLVRYRSINVDQSKLSLLQNIVTYKW